MKTPKIQSPRSTALLISGRPWLYFFIFLMLATLAISYDALAFRKNSAGNLEHRFEVMSEQLKLTDEQAEQILPILENQMQKRKEIFETYAAQGNDDRRELKQHMRALREDTHAQIKDLLTDEQIAKYEAWQGENQQKTRSRGGKGRKRMGSNTY